MIKPRAVAYFVLPLLLLSVTACSKSTDDKVTRKKRPVAGDKVTPVILLGKNWRQGGPVLISARLQVEGKGDAKPTLLQLEDVPYKEVPEATLTFYHDDKLIEEMQDVSLVRDC